MPFLLYLAGVFFLSLYLYNGVLLASPKLSFLFGDTINDGSVNTELPVDRIPEKGENAGENFYVPEDFPIIQYNEQWATMDIEDIGVHTVPVFFGDSDENLAKGIGHFAGSRFPGQMGNIVMSGHATKPFSKLQDIKAGAVIKLHTKYGEYEYVVDETILFHYEDTQYVMPTDGTERLTVYTCYPAGVGFKTQRFAVICSKVSGKNWMTPEVK